MPFSGKRITRITVIYWVLLVYIIAALVWWFISLEEQNSRMTALRTEKLESEKISLTPDVYRQQQEEVEKDRRRNSLKYTGEGLTFLILTLIGAGFVIQSIRRQFRLQHQQQNFMMAVTHELKTPISVARLNLETLLKHHLEEQKKNKLIAMTLEETSRLNFLINNILVSSQLEGDQPVSAREDLDLSDLFKDCVDDFSNRFHDRAFVQDIDPDVDVKGDALLLQLLIGNLVENALKYSPKEEPVTCRLKKVNRNLVMQIIDRGGGIANEEKKKIFEKFYRIGNESTRKTQGTGLGLYLCRKIADVHHARITVSDNSPSGSIFTVTFDIKK